MPKNPVRAARQAGRQQVKAAKQAGRVAKIETRFANKVAKINAGPAPKPAAKPTPVAKPKATTSTTPTVKKARPGIKGRMAEAAYNRKAKKTVFDPSKAKPATKLPASATPATKLNITNDMRGTLKDMPADTRTAKVNKMKADDAKKKQEAAKKKEATKKKDGYGYEPDMFLDAKKGETRQNTLPYTFTDKAKADEARKALKDAIGKIPFGKKKKADTGRYGPSASNNYIGIGSYGQAPEGPAKKIDYTRKRRGGTIKRKK
jgi:hypothetical protein